MKVRVPPPVVLFAAALVAVLVGSRQNLSEPHLRLFSDMVRSPAYRSQAPNPVFRDGRTLQPPPPGTIARSAASLPYGPGPSERARAGEELKNPFSAGLDTLLRGRSVFDSFCSHCHGSAGAGDGAVAKGFPQFSMPVNGQAGRRLADGTLLHIITYGRGLMPAAAGQLDVEDRWLAILYLRDLQRREAERLGPLAEIPEDPRRRSLVSAGYGRELFAANCAGCHGAEGRRPQRGTPTLHSPAVLAIALDDYYWRIINHGRPGTQMPAWKEVFTATQVRSLIAYFRSWAPPPPEPGQVVPGQGSVADGRATFSSHCAGCHGREGRGGVGNSLNAPSFLAVASNKFLRDTISLGRRHTAMPASYDLRAKDVADLIAFMRSWEPPAPSFEAVSALLPAASREAGAKSFSRSCAGCHGAQGGGGLGSKLNDDAFLSMLDERSLYRVIADGRPDTAMPAWRSLPARELADIMAFIRTWQTSPALAPSTWTASGRAEFGEVLFNRNCIKCHREGGQGDLGAQVGNPAYLAQLSDDFLRRTISVGKRGTEMKGFATRARDPLSARDIEHLVAYLRSVQRNPPLEPLHNTYSWADLEAGREVYEKTAECAKCHGSWGEGGTGPALGNPAFLRAATNGFLAATVVLGREQTKMKSYVHGDEPVLEQEQIENVVAYVRAFAKAPAMAARRLPSTPHLVAEGRGLFKAACARCHGDEGQGLREAGGKEYGPSLNNGEFLKAADDNFLLATIALGRPDTPMPPFALGFERQKPLSADQIRALVAFLRSWEKP